MPSAIDHAETPADPSADASGWRRPSHPMQFVIVTVAVALGLMIGTAGVPWTEVPVAGDGSDRLRLGWSEQHAASSHVDPPDTSVGSRAVGGEPPPLGLDGADRTDRPDGSADPAAPLPVDGR